MQFLCLRQHASQDFEAEIFFIPQSIGATLNHPDLVVEALDKAQRDLVLWETVGCDSLPVAVDHLGEFLERFQFLPFQGRTPILEELPGPCNAAVVPQLSEGLLEQV